MNHFIINEQFRTFFRGSHNRFLGGMISFMLLGSGCSDNGDLSKFFEDVTLTSGLSTYTGMTHGVAWGDFNNDGLPDVYLTNHLNSAQLFQNMGNGRFFDVSSQLFKTYDLGGDKHGAVWADINNDGLLDLVQLTGAGRGVGTEPKRLFLNRGDKFEDLAPTLGVSNEYGRTRMPLAVDIDHNGLLDLFHGAEIRFDKHLPPYIFLQQNDGIFTEGKDAVQFQGKSVPFCIITELNNNFHSELVCRVVGHQRTAQILDTSTLPANNLDLLPVTAFEDIAAGDFDNDGSIDLFLARKSPSGQIAFGHPSSNTIIADVKFDTSNLTQPTGFEFITYGVLEFHVKSTFPRNLLNADKIHIGSKDLQPDTMAFLLSKEIAGITGTIAYKPVEQAGVYINFTPPNKWQVFVSGAPLMKKGQYQQFSFNITTTEPITDLVALNHAEKPEIAPARLFMNRDGKLFEESEKRGVNDRLVAATNVVSGDFDNDMDLDLFVLVSGDIGKQENLLLLNNGDGYFSVTSNAGGAAGSKIGVGDSVTTTDFDRDGFLDLLIATGGSMGRSLGLPSDTGGYHLYHNTGNDNHWLEIDLEGTLSSRDGTGAIVRVTVGKTTQIRVQDGGIHHRSQNSQRLHFGLAKHSLVDKISIQWPSGKMQELTDVKADKIMHIKEPAA